MPVKIEDETKELYCRVRQQLHSCIGELRRNEYIGVFERLTGLSKDMDLLYYGNFEYFKPKEK